MKHRLLVISAVTVWALLPVCTSSPAAAAATRNTESAAKLVRDCLGDLYSHRAGIATTKDATFRFDGLGSLSVEVRTQGASLVGHHVAIVNATLYAKFTAADLKALNQGSALKLTATQIHAYADNWLNLGPLKYQQLVPSDPVKIYAALVKNHVTFSRAPARTVGGVVVLPLTLRSTQETEIWYVPVTSVAAPLRVDSSGVLTHLDYHAVAKITAPTVVISAPQLNSVAFYNGPAQPTMLTTLVSALLVK